MKFKPKRTMKIKLSSTEILEIAKALKCGWLDMSKIASFKSLLDGYNPPREITKRQLDYFCECLYNGMGYIPTGRGKFAKMTMAELPTDLKDKWKVSIENGSVYKRLVRDAFFGMVAIKALGGIHTEKVEDFSFCEKEPEFEL